MSPLRLILAVDAITPPLTGIGRYTLALVRGFSAHPEIDQLRLLDRLRWQPPSRYREGEDEARIQGLPRTPSPLRRALGRRALPLLRYGRLLPCRDHLFHSPNYALPPFPGKSVSTLHDLSVIRHPEFHPEERVTHMKRILPSTLQRGDLFLTDSHFSRAEILEVFGIAPDRVIAVPLGVDPRYRPQPPKALKPCLERWGLRPRGYTLSVGTIEPRKNLIRLIEAYRRLPSAMRKEIPLVLAGSPGWRSEEIHQKIREAEAEGWLRYLAYVEEAALPALYAGARLFACVSLYEGFGLPPLEAMASGVPVLAARATSLPEVVGDAGHLVDPLDPSAIQDALETLLEGEARLTTLRTLGLERATAFTWSRTVEETLNAYQRLL